MIQRLLHLPVDASAHGARIDLLLGLVHLLMLGLFVGWIAFFAYTLYRFRRKRSPRADYLGVQSHTSSYLEAAVAVIEVALLVGLSIPFWSWKVSAFPTGPEAVRIRVVAQQFAWNIHYPGPDGVFGRTDIALVNEQTNPIGLDRDGDPHAKDDIVTVNQLHIPVNRPIIIEVTTKDVIHSFSLPLLRVKQDTIPGMMIPLHFVATKTSAQIREELARNYPLAKGQSLAGLVTITDIAGPGGEVLVKKGRSLKEADVAKLKAAGITTVRLGPRVPAEIACAQLCGLGHYRMRGFLTIDDEAGYKAWLEEQASE